MPQVSRRTRRSGKFSVLPASGSEPTWGGGFATGNQVYQFYVSYGWLGAITPFVAMFIQAWVLRSAIIMSRSQNLVSYKDFFNYLWKPYPRLSITFEIFYWIILLGRRGHRHRWRGLSAQ